MRVFEFHFNPKGSEDRIFDSFCYEPENIYEKRRGNLYIIGELRNVLPQNLKFLDNLTSFLKNKYYSAPIKLSPEASLKESLKKSNEFLEGIAKSGDVSWLGNLNFAVISLKNFDLNFTKVGTPKILLLRTGQIIDISKNLEFSEIEPYPLKIFGNIVSGKLVEDDIILVLTKEVFDFFQTQNLIQEVAKIIPFNERKLKEVLKEKNEKLRKISGICLLAVLSREILPQKRQTIVSQPKIKEFSLSQLFRPVTQVSKKLILKLSNFFVSFKKGAPKKLFLKVSRKKARLVKFLRFPKIEITATQKLLCNFKVFIKKRNVILVLTLIFFLLLGFLIFQKEKEEKLKEYQSALNNVQAKVLQAENFLIFKNEEKAQTLFEEAWQELLPLTKVDSTLSVTLYNQISSLENQIEKNLGEFNKLKKIEEPKLLFEFKPREFVPQKMIAFDENLYFFSPYSQNLFKVNKKGEGEIILTNQKFNLATLVEDSMLFFSKPNLLFPFSNNQFEDSLTLQSPYPDPNFKEFSSFKSNLYLLDTKKGEIVKYPHLENLKWEGSQLWLNPQTKKALGAKSMAVDGSIWILNKDYNPPTTQYIDRYYAGNLQETLTLDFFPYPKDFSKIFTSATLPYLYLLEPGQSRIVILNKSGQIVKQYQSEKFDSLLDFSISKDGKTIYLLNGLKVYEIRATNY